MSRVVDAPFPKNFGQHSAQLFGDFLEFVVPLRILELEEAGGPSPADLERARREYHSLWGSEAIYFYEKGKSGKAVSSLVHAIAVLSFAPGGVDIFGRRFIGGNQHDV